MTTETTEQRLLAGIQGAMAEAQNMAERDVWIVAFESDYAPFRARANGRNGQREVSLIGDEIYTADYVTARRMMRALQAQTEQPLTVVHGSSFAELRCQKLREMAQTLAETVDSIAA